MLDASKTETILRIFRNTEIQLRAAGVNINRMRVVVFLADDEELPDLTNEPLYGIHMNKALGLNDAKPFAMNYCNVSGTKTPIDLNFISHSSYKEEP